MARRNLNTLDFTQQPLCLAGDLRYWPIHQRGELVYRIEIPSLHRYFRVGYEEYLFLSLLDGQTTIPQACGLAAAKLGSRAPSAADAITICKWLLKNELACFSSDMQPSREPHRADGAATTEWSWLRRFNPFWIKVPLPKSNALMRSCSRLLNPVFSSAAILLGMALIAIAVCIVGLRWADFSASSAALFLPNNWIGLFVAWVGLKVVHEMAHAVACQRMGGEVSEAGIVFVLVAPLAYVDVSSCWRMNSRWSRIAVASAGMYVELVIAAAALVMWSLTESVAAKFILYQLVITAGLSTLVFNANILMRFDGYFILADLIDVPNLQSEASLSIRNLLSRMLTGKWTSDRSLGSWRRYFVFAYGVAALLWRVVVCVSLFIAASTMFAGAGIVIALAGMCIWLASPIKLIFGAMRTLLQAGLTQSIRPLVVSSGLLAAAAWLVFFCPIPTAISVPSVVDYLPETSLRSRTSGFIRMVHVVDGQTVNRGDRLLTIENRELVTQLEELELTWQQNEIRLRQATDMHDASQQQILRMNQASLTQQMQPLRTQVAALDVISPRTGRVVAPALAQRLGAYVAEGDALLTVASEADKQLIAVIGEDVVDEVRGWLGQAVTLRSPCFPELKGRLERIEPRATDRLPSAALAATAGGPLAVRPANDPSDVDSWRLLDPVFRGRIDLSPAASARLPAGLRLRTSFGFQSQSLFQRWSQTIGSLWYRAQKSVADSV
ncbi:MAG: efflux RND transporter periplasmic adaptor subunit [Planctomycetales bacterium]|nr:efflux RND transporter periplasmic adaptor subunit [Planctomycetales bacterium]